MANEDAQPLGVDKEGSLMGAERYVCRSNDAQLQGERVAGAVPDFLDKIETSIFTGASHHSVTG
jgi:hypothetical protein